MPRDSRLIGQVQLIIAASGGEVGIYPPDWEEQGDFSYMYRKGTILVRDADVARVRRALGDRVVGEPDPPPPPGEPAEPGTTGEPGTTREPNAPDSDGPEPSEPSEPSEPRTVPGVVAGVTSLTLRGWTTPAALQFLDDAVGVGVARPDHVVYVCGYPCPATEPEEVPAGTVEPFPAPGLDACRSWWCRPPGRCDGKGVFVGVVDTGFLPGATQHPWLSGVEGDQENPLDANGQYIRSYAGHGTFAAGCVRVGAPKSSVCVSGALPYAGADYESNIVRTLAKALRPGRSPDVLVFTFVSPTRHCQSMHAFDALYESVIRHLGGLVVLAPAGNDSSHDFHYPAAYPWVVSVGALSADWRTRAAFSNYGGWVDVYAPGEHLVNAFATGEYVCDEDPNKGQHRKFDGMARWSGTSFSTPLVGGMIAARMSRTGENGRQAADSLLRLALGQAVPGVGAVLYPGQACCHPLRRHCRWWPFWCRWPFRSGWPFGAMGPRGVKWPPRSL